METQTLHSPNGGVGLRAPAHSLHNDCHPNHPSNKRRDGVCRDFKQRKELHFEAWRDTAEKAAHIPRYKYALYASRSLAVKHPELYLQGDAIFNKLLASLPNMALFLHRTA